MVGFTSGFHKKMKKQELTERASELVEKIDTDEAKDYLANMAGKETDTSRNFFISRPISKKNR